MPNDTEVQVDAPEETEEQSEETTTQETKAEKPKETPEQKKARLQRQLKQVMKQLGEADEEPVAPSKPKSSDLDYGQKAFLATYGIKGSDELALVKTWVTRTGDDIDALVDDEIFNAKLTALREARATKQATPSTSKRSQPTAQDDVDFWLTKPFEEVPSNLKGKVLNARIAREKSSKGNFSDTPIVLG